MSRGLISSATAVLASIVVGIVGGGVAAAAEPSPEPPSAVTGQTGPRTVAGARIRQIAAGVPIPTEFAFGDGHVFVGGAGAHDYPDPGGGVYLLRKGRAFRLKGSPDRVTGVAWHGGALYISGDETLERWSGFTGSQFRTRNTIYTGPGTFQGFNGIAFGPDGRLYVGATVGNDDSGPTTDVYARDILSFNADGGDLQVFARGIRQPWQMAFAKGSSSPYVTDEGPDEIPSQPNPPDMLLHVHAGQNYGFPGCDWSAPTACAGLAKPFRLLAPHTDPMGIAVLGNRVYFNDYGVDGGAKVLWTARSGGAIGTTAVGFRGYIVALGQRAGRLYVGKTTGQIYRFTPRRPRP